MEDFIVNGNTELQQLISKSKPSVTGRIKLEVNQLKPEETLKFERKINNWHNACGCETGALFSMISIACFAIYAFINVMPFNWILVRTSLIIFLMAALFGKITGILIAKFRLKRTVKQLMKKLNGGSLNAEVL